MEAGYFIAPSGDIIPIARSHIESVINNPEKFRMTLEEIKEIHEKYNEKIGMEGKARGEILADLMKQGWIRIRYLPKSDTFTFQLDNLTSRKKDWIFGFAEQAIDPGIKGKKYSPYSEIKILDLNTNILGKYSLKELSEDVLYKKSKVKQAVISLSDYNVSEESMNIKFAFNMQRVWTHYKKGKFGIISAYTNDFTKKENEERSNKLKEQIRSLGYGYKEIRGVWKGEDGIIFEYPLFIPEISAKDAKALGKEYDQEAVIYAEAKDEVILWDTKADKKIMTFTKIETNGQEAWEGYSELKGKKFRYSSIEWHFPMPNNPEEAKSSKWMLAMAHSSYFKEKYSDFDRSDENKLRISYKTLQKLS